MIKFKNKKKTKIDAHTWLWDNIEDIVDRYAGGYVVLVDNREGILYSDADGSPAEIVKRAKRKFPKSSPLFFRVPHSQDFLCALIMR